MVYPWLPVVLQTGSQLERELRRVAKAESCCVCASLVTGAGRTFTFTWNERTRFMTASPLRKGVRAAIVYHQPFSREPFVSRVSVVAHVQSDTLPR